jgi:hypothetical protein
MVGYELIKTVSENGTVSPGICQVDDQGLLRGMEEHTKLEKTPDGVISHRPDGSREAYTGGEPVSMNLFGVYAGHPPGDGAHVRRLPG